MQDRDIATVRRLDRAATGADRSAMLDARRAYARAASVMRGGDDGVTGFALATPQHDALVVGPVVAPDPAIAAALIAHVAADHAGPVRVELLSEQTALTARLAAAGFEASDDAPLMMYGGDSLPGDRQRLYALATRGFC